MKVVRETGQGQGQGRSRSSWNCASRGTARCIHQDAKRHRAFALRWVGSEPGGAAYLGGAGAGPGAERPGVSGGAEGVEDRRR